MADDKKTNADSVLVETKGKREKVYVPLYGEVKIVSQGGTIVRIDTLDQKKIT